MTRARTPAPARVSSAKAAPVRASRAADSPLAALQRTAGNRAVRALIERDLAGSGRALDAATRANLEPRLGERLDRVRVHVGRSPDVLGARAYATGDHVVLAPATTEPAILAHELAHVVLQRRRPPREDFAITAPAGPGERAADALLYGPRPAEIRDTPAAPAMRRIEMFAPEGHRRALIGGLGKTYNADEIGQIDVANWERDFSQGTPLAADLVIAWKEVLLESKVPGSFPQASAHFKAALNAALSLDPNKVRDEANEKETLGGYRSWEHMDNPGTWVSWNPQVAPTLPGYLVESRAYVKDQIAMAVDSYREVMGLQLLRVDPWSDPRDGVHKPHGYGEPTKLATSEPKLPRDAVREDTRRKAIAAGVPPATRSNPDDAAFAAAAPHIGRASHSIEDFFAHSNFLALAREVAPRREVKWFELETGTFERTDKIQSLGYKLRELTAQMVAFFDVALAATGGSPSTKAFGNPKKKGDNAHDKLRDDSHWMPVYEYVDVEDAAQMILRDVRSGHATLDDVIGNRRLIEDLQHKADQMINHATRSADAHGHARLAKDNPGDVDYEPALALATRATAIILGPLKSVMKIPDKATATRLLNAIFARIDSVISVPGPRHPLRKVVK